VEAEIEGAKMTAGSPYRPAPAGTHPPHHHPEYRSTSLRHPRHEPLVLPQTLSEQTGPGYRSEAFGIVSADLTQQASGPPLGERIVVEGRVLDCSGRPLRDTLVELWQANAAGRYAHPSDTHDAPLDPNFRGGGRTLTDAEGRYRFITIRPGAYPWKNHDNAWRPAHLHFSLLGPSFASRLVTQMYFPGDPLLALDPIFNSVPDPRARERLIARFDLEIARPEWALGYRFDLILRGRESTPMDTEACAP
jgi:protocatechuate 3,4-dioxygenase, beta subunit